MIPAPAMKVALWMTFLAAVILFAAMHGAQSYFGLERSGLSGQQAGYTADDVRRLAGDERRAAGFVIPILFPLDLMFLAAFGAFLMLCSIHFAGAAGIPRDWTWLLIVLPAIYVAADLSENVLLTRLLTDSDAVSDRAVVITQSFTRLKFATAALGSAQTLVVVAMAVLLRR
jgi:hypothetical protein